MLKTTGRYLIQFAAMLSRTVLSLP
uniref:Uncharacterized protein n=1 Tax=Arundo donax TaxID=35708 RepID=A0A0A9I385_ARUDO